MDFEFVAVIDCPLADVFALFRDVDQYNEHEGSPVPVLDKITEGPVRVGTRYREVVQMMPFVTMTILSEITEYESERRLASRWWSNVMEGRLAYTFELVDGGVRVIQRMSLNPKGVLRVFSPLIKVMFSRAGEHRLAWIKAFLEARASTPQVTTERVP
ncbi:MAG TPA: SRPBCC family protein [Anaerolineae bacterium]|nr:SRPBCC family protein [Anaerolineae bacterium]HQI83687.1 SRPBCC family protein [Anaerolineae bacterium]